MRWERLFAELEASLLDETALERDALADELTDEEWGAVASGDLIWGEVRLEIHGAGWIEGTVVQATDDFVVLQTGRHSDLVVARTAIVAWRGGRGRPDDGLLAGRLGWRHLFRAARQTGDRLRCGRLDGGTLTGHVTAVAADAVCLDDGATATWLRHAAIATVCAE